MIPLDNTEIWLKRLDDETFAKILTENEKEKWDQISLDEKGNLLTAMFEKPIHDFGMMYRWYYRNKWSEAMHMTGKQAPVRVLEMASGGDDTIPRTLSATFNHPQTTYVTANSNKALTAQFREYTRDIPIGIEIIEDNGIRIEDYSPNDAFDMVAHQHSVNDMIYDIICRKNGLDTVNTPWFDMYPTQHDGVSQQRI